MYAAQLALYKKFAKESIVLLNQVADLGKPVSPINLQRFYAQDKGLESELLITYRILQRSHHGANQTRHPPALPANRWWLYHFRLKVRCIV